MTDDITTQNWFNQEYGHEEVVGMDLVCPTQGAPLFSALADVRGFRHTSVTQYPTTWYSGNYEMVTSVEFCETNPNILATANYNYNGYGGVAISTDNGQTWNSINSPTNSSYGGKLAISANDPNNIIWTPLNEPIYFTSNGGKSWAKSSGLPSSSFYSSVWNWNKYLCADKVNDNTFYVFDNGAIWMSTDGGNTFNRQTKSPGTTQWFVLVKSAPNSAGEVWVLNGNTLYQSTDSGQTLNQINTISNVLLFGFGIGKQGSNYALYVYGSVNTNNQWIYRSDDSGKTWTQLTNATEPIGDSPNLLEGDRQTYGVVYVSTNGRGIFYNIV